MVNGALLFSKENLDIKRHYKKTGYLFLGLLGWKGLYLISSLIFKWSDINDLNFLVLFKYFFSTTSINISTNHLWFMYSLIQIYMIFPMIKICKDRNKKLFYFLVGCLIFFNHVIFEVDWFVSCIFNYLKIEGRLFSGITTIFSNNYYLTYFVFGSFLYETIERYKNRKKDMICAGGLFVISGLAGIELHRYVEFGTLHFNFTVTSAKYMSIFTLMLAIGVFLMASQITFKEWPSVIKKIIVYVSINTNYVYYIHKGIAVCVYDMIFPLLSRKD